jgi:hypothetical protein
MLAGSRNYSKCRDVIYHVVTRGRLGTIQFENPRAESPHLYGRYLFLTTAFRSELKHLDPVKIFAEEYDLFLRLRRVAQLCLRQSANDLGSESDGTHGG